MTRQGPFLVWEGQQPQTYLAEMPKSDGPRPARRVVPQSINRKASKPFPYDAKASNAASPQPAKD